MHNSKLLVTTGLRLVDGYLLSEWAVNVFEPSPLLLGTMSFTFLYFIASLTDGAELLINGAHFLQVYHRQIIRTTYDGGTVITLGLIRLPPMSKLNKVEVSTWDGYSQY